MAATPHAKEYVHTKITTHKVSNFLMLHSNPQNSRVVTRPVVCGGSPLVQATSRTAHLSQCQSLTGSKMTNCQTLIMQSFVRVW